MGRRSGKSRRWVQMTLQAAPGKHGGLRRDAGRKAGRRTTVERVARPDLAARHPVHVTMRLRPDAPRLRRHRAYGVLRLAFRRGKDRFGFRLAHFSVQSNHIHLVCEAADKRALSRGMQGLSIRIARALNRLAGRRGRVLADRYHARVLKSPTEVRNALRYVLRNAVHHRAAPNGPFLDVFSSAALFDGWRERTPRVLLDDDGPPIVR